MVPVSTLPCAGHYKVSRGFIYKYGEKEQSVSTLPVKVLSKNIESLQ